MWATIRLSIELEDVPASPIVGSYPHQLDREVLLSVQYLTGLCQELRHSGGQ